MDGSQEITPPLTLEETIMTHNQVRDLHEKYCKQESRISKLEASDQFQNKQLEKLILTLGTVILRFVILNFEIRNFEIRFSRGNLYNTL